MSMTTFVGGGGPRFWSSATPEDRQTNYAQIILRTKDDHDTTPLLALLQPEFDKQIPGAIIDTRTLETGKPVGIPVQVRISGEDLPRLRAEADKLKQIFREIPIAARVRDDWGEPSVKEVMHVDVGPGKPGARHERRCFQFGRCRSSRNYGRRIERRRQADSDYRTHADGGACPALRFTQPVCVLGARYAARASRAGGDHFAGTGNAENPALRSVPDHNGPMLARARAFAFRGDLRLPCRS